MNDRTNTIDAFMANRVIWGILFAATLLTAEISTGYSLDQGIAVGVGATIGGLAGETIGRTFGQIRQIKQKLATAIIGSTVGFMAGSITAFQLASAA